MATTNTNTDVREEVKARYGSIAAESAGACCAPTEEASSCCGTTAETASNRIGYSAAELQSLPEGANLGLGCGNPLALAGVKEGDTVVDLGSGAGIDCFLASQRVGETGKVIGVDMTPEMLAKARANAEKGGYTNVEFREGVIEKLPIEDNSVDVITSNCVINLSPDKQAVFNEIYRVLKPGGRFYVSDIVILKPLPESVLQSTELLTACVSGALLKKDYLGTIKVAGFNEVEVTDQRTFPLEMLSADPNFKNLPEAVQNLPREDVEAAAESLASVKVEGRKAFGPGLNCCGGV